MWVRRFLATTVFALTVASPSLACAQVLPPANDARANAEALVSPPAGADFQGTRRGSSGDHYLSDSKLECVDYRFTGSTSDFADYYRGMLEQRGWLWTDTFTQGISSPPPYSSILTFSQGTIDSEIRLGLRSSSAPPTEGAATASICARESFAAQIPRQVENAIPSQTVWLDDAIVPGSAVCDGCVIMFASATPQNFDVTYVQMTTETHGPGQSPTLAGHMMGKVTVELAPDADAAADALSKKIAPDAHTGLWDVDPSGGAGGLDYRVVEQQPSHVVQSIHYIFRVENAVADVSQGAAPEEITASGAAALKLAVAQQALLHDILTTLSTTHAG